MATGGGEDAGVSELVKLLLEDRRQREEASARREAELAEERARRETEHARQVRQMEEQVHMMREWMERSQAREGERAMRDDDRLKLTKLTESEDVEAFLTTFERMMRVYGVKEERWAFKLAPQLTGKAQQAYAALNVEDSAPLLTSLALLGCHYTHCLNNRLLPVLLPC